MNALAECVGYACPPENSVPAGEVIVKTVTDLAETGVGTELAPILIAVAAVAMVCGAFLIEWGNS